MQSWRILIKLSESVSTFRTVQKMWLQWPFFFACTKRFGIEEVSKCGDTAEKMIFIHASTNATNGQSQIFPVSLADFAVLVSFFFFVLEGNRYGPFVFESLKSPPKCYRITNPQRHGIIGTFTRFYYLQCMHLMWILIVFPIPFDLHIELREKNLFSFQFSDPIHEEGIYLVLTHMKYGTLNYRWLSP